MLVAPTGMGCTSSGEKRVDEGKVEQPEKPEHERHTINEGPIDDPPPPETPPEPDTVNEGPVEEPTAVGVDEPEAPDKPNVNPGPKPEPPPPPQPGKRVNTGPQTAPKKAPE